MVSARLLPLLLAGCATAGEIDPVRFRNQPPVWRVGDRLDTPKPSPRDFPLTLYMFDRFLVRSLTRVMEVSAPARAANVNSLDEVPDSTWFENRIGVRAVAPQELNWGGGPDTSQPWKILGTKVGGVTPGFLMEDARGSKYLLKFDGADVPEMETAADVIGQRLIWAAGWSTAQDSIVRFRREQLVLAPNAKVKDAFGHSRPMTEKDLGDTLARINRREDGSYRGMASRLLAGVPIGGYAQEGIRADDPNDRIAHEERRDVRGQLVVFSWINHTDIKEDNTLDMWIESGGRHFVMHYLIDFGSAFGVLGQTNRAVGDGFTYFLDFGYIAASTLALGVWRRPWEGADGPALRGIGRIEGDRFDPSNWKPRYPYVPYARFDDFDGFWGARLVMRFSPELIRAAVMQGQFDDPRAVDYLVDTLLARQRKIGRYWFSRVNPLDHFEAKDGGLCFEDLWLTYGFGSNAHYRAVAYDFDGHPTGWSETAAGSPRICLSGVAAGRDHEGYVVLGITTERDGRTLSPVFVHLALDPQTHTLRVIGIRRT